MTKTRFSINNATKVITLTNSVFESLSREEENSIARYESRGYSLDIIDNKKRKESASQKLTDKQILANSAEGSRELHFSLEESADFIKRYKAIKRAKGFQSAKGFYCEVYKARNGKSDRTLEEVYAYYESFVVGEEIA